MAHVYGICNSSPSNILTLFLKKNLIASESDIKILPTGLLLNPEKRYKKLIFVLTISDFLKNLEVFNSSKYEDTKIFVFSSPLRINELTNCIPLDLSIDPSAKGFGFILKNTIDLQKYKSSLLKTYPPVVRDVKQHLSILTEAVKKGSLLTPLMTFIYSLSSATLQTPTKIAVARIIAHGLPITSLDKQLQKLCDYTLSSKAKDKLFVILNSDVSKRYIEAFKQYRKLKKEKGTVVLASIAKTYDVNPYEIRYLLSVLDNDLKKIKEKKNKPVKLNSKKKAKK